MAAGGKSSELASLFKTGQVSEYLPLPEIAINKVISKADAVAFQGVPVISMYIHAHPLVDAFIQRCSRPLSLAIAGVAVAAALNGLYVHFLQPAFNWRSIAISHTFQIPRMRSRPIYEPADALRNPVEILSNIDNFISELDPDTLQKVARLKVSDNGFSSTQQITDSKNLKVQYKSLYFKWLWQEHLLAHLMRSVTEASAPDEPINRIHLPWWCIVELKLKSESDDDIVRDEMANRLTDLMTGRLTQGQNQASKARNKKFSGYEIKITGCFCDTAKAVVQTLIESLSTLQKKKTNAQGYRRPDIAVFDLVKEDDYSDNTIPTQASGCWRKRMEAPIRPLHSVHIPRNSMNALCHDLKTFLASKGRLESMGLKWRRGYLLHGPPGNGKSTFIRAVANELGCDIFNLCVSDPAINDGNWRALLEPISRRGPSILLLEDFDGCFKFDVHSDTAGASSISNDEERDVVPSSRASIPPGVDGEGGFGLMDTIKPERRQLSKGLRTKVVPVQAVNISNRSSNSLTYPSILQLLESGFFTFIFVTTNSLQTLQQMSALVRPGRIDFSLEFRNADPDQVKGLFMMFYAHFKKSSWKESKLQDLEEDFNNAFDEARSQVDFLKPCDESVGDADVLLHNVVSIGEHNQKRTQLYEHRISHLGRIRDKVREIAFSQAEDVDRKHWLSALGSIAGNHFQSRIHKYSMAQIEKFFQNMILGHKRTTLDNPVFSVLELHRFEVYINDGDGDCSEDRDTHLTGPSNEKSFADVFSANYIVTPKAQPEDSFKRVASFTDFDGAPAQRGGRAFRGGRGGGYQGRR